MTTRSTLAELAVTHPAAARVFHRRGLDFCCGGRTALADACRDRDLDPAQVLADIDAETPRPEDDRRWDREPLPVLVAHIVETYHRRLRDVLPDLIRMAERVEERHGGKTACPRGLAAHLAAVRDAVIDHLDKEEQVLFPIVLSGRGRNARGPVQVMELEHDEHARNLQVTRALTHDYQPPDEACTTWRALYLALQQFEQELTVHIHLENNVLFRRALAE